jgi:hypothetical protein
MLKETLNDKKTFLLNLTLLDDEYSMNEICEFVMRKFLKQNRIKYCFEIKDRDIVTAESIVESTVDNKIDNIKSNIEVTNTVVEDNHGEYIVYI